VLAVDHPAYREHAALGTTTCTALAGDLD